MTKPKHWAKGMHISIPPDMHMKLRQYCFENDIRKSAFIIKALKQTELFKEEVVQAQVDNSVTKN